MTELDEAHKYLHHRTARYLSLFSLSVEQYALSADMSRLVLKSSSNKGNSASSSSSSNNNTAARFDGAVWVQRALALSAMGNTYLGKLHLCSAVGGGQLIPGLGDDALTAYVSELEHKHAMDYLSRSEDQRVLRELHHQLDVLLSTSSTKLRTNSDLTSISQSDIQTFLYGDADVAPSSSSSSSSVSASASSITGSSDCGAILSHIMALIDAKFTANQKGMKCNLDVLLARFNKISSSSSCSSSGDGECDLMVWLLVDLLIKLFYEAQVRCLLCVITVNNAY